MIHSFRALLALILLFASPSGRAEEAFKIPSQGDGVFTVAQARNGGWSTNGAGETSQARVALARALREAKSRQYLNASTGLFALSRSPELRAERMQIKYILGLMLFELGLNQVAAFQFVDVIKQGNNNYVDNALEKLSIAADRLGDDTLLNYAISKVRVDDFPAEHRDMLNFRIGELKMSNKQFAEAAEYFRRVDAKSRYGSSALYNEGLAYTQAGELRQAADSFKNLIRLRQGAGVTDRDRVAGVIGLARVFYQAKSWDASLAVYRQVPKDTEFWHEALFESSWAMMRSGKFRSALSNFHSLHSPYYEDSFIPESLILRGIVYLYICKYDEMEKTLAMFENTYETAKKDVDRFLNSTSTPQGYYSELERATRAREDRAQGKEISAGLILPYIVSKSLLDEGDIRRGLAYIRQLNAERSLFEKQPEAWKSSALGTYAEKILANRTQNTIKLVGENARNHLRRISVDLRDFSEQAGFLQYEMISGQKSQIKQNFGQDDSESHIDSDADRTYYIQNGYEYWPFQGEYWLDEIGNYHYLGKRSCE